MLPKGSPTSIMTTSWTRNWQDNDEEWMIHFSEVEALYHENDGVFPTVFQEDEVGLRKWIAMQDYNRLNDKLTQEQIDRLSSLNFPWKEETEWSENVRRLERSPLTQALHLHQHQPMSCRVPEDHQLARWVQQQHELLSRGELPEDRKAILMKLRVFNKEMEALPQDDHDDDDDDDNNDDSSSKDDSADMVIVEAGGRTTSPKSPPRRMMQIATPYLANTMGNQLSITTGAATVTVTAPVTDNSSNNNNNKDKDQEAAEDHDQSTSSEEPEIAETNRNAAALRLQQLQQLQEQQQKMLLLQQQQQQQQNGASGAALADRIEEEKEDQPPIPTGSAAALADKFPQTPSALMLQQQQQRRLQLLTGQASGLSPFSAPSVAAAAMIDGETKDDPTSTAGAAAASAGTGFGSADYQHVLLLQQQRRLQVLNRRAAVLNPLTAAASGASALSSLGGADGGASALSSLAGAAGSSTAMEEEKEEKASEGSADAKINGLGAAGLGAAGLSAVGLGASVVGTAGLGPSAALEESGGGFPGSAALLLQQRRLMQFRQQAAAAGVMGHSSAAAAMMEEELLARQQEKLMATDPTAAAAAAASGLSSGAGGLAGAGGLLSPRALLLRQQQRLMQAGMMNPSTAAAMMEARSRLAGEETTTEGQPRLPNESTPTAADLTEAARGSMVDTTNFGQPGGGGMGMVLAQQQKLQREQALAAMGTSAPDKNESGMGEAHSSLAHQEDHMPRLQPSVQPDAKGLLQAKYDHSMGLLHRQAQHSQLGPPKAPSQTIATANAGLDEEQETSPRTTPTNGTRMANENGAAAAATAGGDDIHRGPPKSLLPLEYSPCPNTVIVGRGKKVAQHPGNVRLRQLVQNHLQEYSAATTKAGKSDIIVRVLAEIRFLSEYAFVKQETKSQRWYPVEESAQRITLAQAFRDALKGSYKSSRAYKKQQREGEKNKKKGSGGGGMGGGGLGPGMMTI